MGGSSPEQFDLSDAYFSDVVTNWHYLKRLLFSNALSFLPLWILRLSACLCLEFAGRYGPQAHTPSHWWGWVRRRGGGGRHPCRDHFEICEDFRAIWTRCQSAPDSKGWQRYPTVQYGSLFNELLTVPRFNWCDIWAIYLWHFNEGWFSALPFTFLCYFLRVICIFLL